MATYSTRAEALAAYRASTDYMAGSGSVSKAEALQSACLFLLSCPEEIEHGGSGGQRVVIPVKQLESALDRVTSWLDVQRASGTSGGGIKHVSFENFRE